MPLLDNIRSFRNWHELYLAKYGLLRGGFDVWTRDGLRIRVRPWAEDRRIIRSVFVKQQYTNDFVRIRPTDVVVDVGANIGAFALFGAGRARRVLALEPEPSNFKSLCTNVERNGIRNVRPLQLAAAGRNGRAVLRIGSRRHTGGHSFYLTKYERELEIETVTLEELMDRESVDRIGFLKLDCEGAEHDIVEGLTPGGAKRIDQISMELHVDEKRPAARMRDRLRSLGFQIAPIDRPGYLYARR